MTDDAQSPALAKQCGTSVHATEALLCNLQEQKTKHLTTGARARLASGRLRYMILYMISRNNDIDYDIICLELSMIS
jgi:hypothetical protein